MAEKDKFKAGDRVKFRRSHDKGLQLEGTVVRVHDNDDDCVDVETIPDGKILEVSTIETAHAVDVTLINLAVDDVSAALAPKKRLGRKPAALAPKKRLGRKPAVEESAADTATE